LALFWVAGAVVIMLLAFAVGFERMVGRRRESEKQ
jgi:hypothetical protein